MQTLPDTLAEISLFADLSSVLAQVMLFAEERALLVRVFTDGSELFVLLDCRYLQSVLSERLRLFPIEKGIIVDVA
jgi:hypothetical protein